jgi:hypothetical protein
MLNAYWKISKHLLNEFQTSISDEPWENVFSNNDNDTNTIFNNFLNTFLRKFYASLPKKIVRNSKAWLTTGIKTSCSNKRKLYLLYRKSNNPKLKIYYENYCKILSKIIILVKKCTTIIN